MADLVTLTCWTCDASFTMERRRGQYPTRCIECEATELAARRLRRRVQILGLHCDVERDPTHGYVVRVTTPFHDRPVIVRDRHDVEWLLTEIAAARHGSRAA